MIKQLGKYEITQLLGRGAMGEVYLAHHPVIGRDVAIKTILGSAHLGGEGEERFRREAAAAGKLNHPNVVTLYDFDRDGETLYLVMEYIPGEDLEALIRNRSLSHGEVLELLAQVCDGLGYAHRHGILHRDIKPSNVRVIRDEVSLTAKIVDFGVARLESSNLTTTGTVVGTVSYLAPEYIQSGKSTIQGDLWAVGVMLYECLSGRKPFDGSNITTILFKIVSETPKPLELKEIEGISPSIRDVLLRVLAKEPAQRFPSAEALAQALRACKDPTWSTPVEEHTARLARKALDLQPEKPLPKSKSKKPVVWAAAAVGVLTLAGAGVYFWPSQPKAVAPASPAKPAENPAFPHGMKFVSIPPGSFRMGGGVASDENPIHPVTLSHAFQMQSTPVTVAQFRIFANETGSVTDAERVGNAWAQDEQGQWDELNGVSWRSPGFGQTETCPVVCITWNDAKAFIEWLNRTDPGKGYRLPSEAEWEYACRAGSGHLRYGELSTVAWYRDTSGMQTHPVAQKAPNSHGLFDMLGNAWQWCEDRYGPYTENSKVDPKGSATGEHRVLRGGSWFSDADACTAAARTKGLPDSRGNYVGFRLVCNSPT